jgi:competence protein ComEC
LAEKPLAVVAIAFAVGILAAAHVSLGLCVTLAGTLALPVLVMKPGQARTTLAILLAAFVVGAARYSVSREVPASDISNLIPAAIGFRGRVVAEPESRPGRVRLLMRVSRVLTYRGWRSATGMVAVTVYDSASRRVRLDYGDSAIVRVRPYIPMEPTNPGQFSWREYLARQGIYSCASVRDAASVTKCRSGDGSLIAESALATKRYITASIARLHPKREAGLISGMVLGTYAYLSPDILRDFQRTGTLHLLAASGFNCFVLVFLASPVLTWLGVLPKGKSFVIIVLLVLYLLMVGLKPSLVRATVMMSLYILARLLKRVPRTQNLFFAAVIVVLAMNPADLFDVGFQLSFLGVWALIWFMPLAEAMLRRVGWSGAAPGKKTPLWPRLVGRGAGIVVETAAGTIAVSLLVDPVIAYNFNYVSLVSLPANVAMGLGVTLVFADGLASAILAPIPILGQALGLVGTQVARAMLSVADTLGAPNWSALSVATPTPLMIAGYYMALYGVYSYLRSRYAAK